MVKVESGLLVPELFEHDLELKDAVCIHGGELEAVAAEGSSFAKWCKNQNCLNWGWKMYTMLCSFC